MESWSVDYVILPGDTADPAVWRELSKRLASQYPFSDGSGGVRISRLAVDTGYNAQTVYQWCRAQITSLVMPIKGSEKASSAVGSPSPVDVTQGGRKIRRGLKLWSIGVNAIKADLYAKLRLHKKDGDVPPGYCHFPGYPPEFFCQICAEEQFDVRDRHGVEQRKWRKIRERNEALDCRVYAMAAAISLGLDRWPEERWSEVQNEREFFLSPPTAPEKPVLPDVIESNWLK